MQQLDSTKAMSPRELLVASKIIALACLALLLEGHASAQDQPHATRADLAADSASAVAASDADEGCESAAGNPQLGEFLVGTKWLMYEIPGRIVEFGENGKFELEDWKMQGIEAQWKVTGPRQVTVTVTSQKFHHLTALLNFDGRLSYFTGHDLDPKRQITKSPRINHVPNDPADPYHR
jgi:hypothetical protein